MPNCEQLSFERFAYLCGKYDVPLKLILAIQETDDITEREQLCSEVGKFFISAMCSFRVDDFDSKDVRIAAGLNGDENIIDNVLFPNKV